MLLQKCLLDTTLFLIKHANIRAVQEGAVITVLAVNEMCQVIQIFWSVKGERNPSSRPDCRGASFCLHDVKYLIGCPFEETGSFFSISVEAV